MTESEFSPLDNQGKVRSVSGRLRNVQFCCQRKKIQTDTEKDLQPNLKEKVNSWCLNRSWSRLKAWQWKFSPLNIYALTLVSGAVMNLAGTLKLTICFPVNFLFFWAEVPVWAVIQSFAGAAWTKSLRGAPRSWNCASVLPDIMLS